MNNKNTGVPLVRKYLFSLSKSEWCSSS